MISCEICPRQCRLEDGQTGFCGARANRDGRIVCENYGKITSLALDPIEKKPLKRFFPNSMILSVGSYGCNFRCPFCQNYRISMDYGDVEAVTMSPAELVERAESMVPLGNLGLAYTYNEPLVGYEFVFDCAKLIREKGLKNVLVTNGYVMEKPFAELLPYLDAANIDLKSYSQDFYKKIGGDLAVVKKTIEAAAKAIHVEVTTLIIPGENDSEEQMKELTSWLASVDDTIPLHLSRFFPSYHMLDRNATSVDTIERLAEIAGASLKYVYKGNL
ncbi:MAG: AmmeMemoRadiSam system radical SAM enzyme [Eubacteriales bacterium]|nr:AmmeMemoRadiSam system radical SAM enzyme [Eubacteriales bacterium]